MSKRYVNPSPDDFVRAGVTRPVPKMMEFTNDERAKIVRWLERQMVHFDFRMEELGPKPEIDVMRKYWRGQKSYYKHCRKFCRWLISRLECRDRMDEGERD